MDEKMKEMKGLMNMGSSSSSSSSTTSSMLLSCDEDHHVLPFSSNFSYLSGIFDVDVEKGSSSLGLMELLGNYIHHHDHNQPQVNITTSSTDELPSSIKHDDHDHDHHHGFDQLMSTESPNSSSIYSSSIEAHGIHQDDEQAETATAVKVDEGQDQKQSYYRCTNATCGVKKRVERSAADPAMVITTYEGQHTHHSPMALRDLHHRGPFGLIHHHNHPNYPYNSSNDSSSGSNYASTFATLVTQMKQQQQEEPYSHDRLSNSLHSTSLSFDFGHQRPFCTSSDSSLLGDQDHEPLRWNDFPPDHN
ncbi:hypothetical protein Scep_008843 [Stephania cephalantha]|uniref:WRKY domain-containing protein n=1 Tax=Stephania cephalantha TaxID=152367 RepID=A0AAP0PCJ5_9MAGN